ncbi:MAG: hypothetical protein LBG94_03810, partial [Treponema sp.]|nr:hypothetical protein [Treponema sp.]
MSEVQNAKNELEKQIKASADASANITAWEKQVNVLLASQKTAGQAVSDVNKRISEINVTINGLRNFISQLKREGGAKPTDSQKAEIKKQEDKLTAENNKIASIKSSDLAKAQQKQGSVNNELNLARKNLTDARNAKTAADNAIKAAEKAVTAAEYEQDAGVTEKFVDSLMAELTKLSMKDITDWVKKAKEWEVNLYKSQIAEAQQKYNVERGVMAMDGTFQTTSLYKTLKKDLDDANMNLKSPNRCHQVADNLIHDTAGFHGMLNGLIGFTGSFAIPASAAAIVKTYHSKAKLAYTIANVYGLSPSGNDFKIDLYILFQGKTFFREFLSGVQSKVEGAARQQAGELIKADFKRTQIYAKLNAQGAALKTALLRYLPARLKTDAVKLAAKSAGTKVIPIASVALSGVSAFKDM